MADPQSTTEVTQTNGVVISDTGKLKAFIEQTHIRLIAKAMTQVPGVASEVASAEIVKADKARQAFEDQRANRRNRNRSYTILVALLMTFAVPYVLADIFHAAAVLKFATGIAIVPDGFITLYAWIKHY